MIVLASLSSFALFTSWKPGSSTRVLMFHSFRDQPWPFLFLSIERSICDGFIEVQNWNSRPEAPGKDRDFE